MVIVLNADYFIKKLGKPSINGDIKIYETKNKAGKLFIDFLYRFKSPISVQKEK